MKKELLFSLAVMPLAGISEYGQTVQQESPPNIILFLVDDMGWHRVTDWTYPKNETTDRKSELARGLTRYKSF